LLGDDVGVADKLIAAYDPGWADLFAGLAGRLRAELGDVAVRIDHIGSRCGRRASMPAQT
jgi:GrpB-like predicted nucleotidyltransferase (UPF0157 family)